MTAAPIHLGSERLMLDPAGGLIWPAAGLLAVSDLHLEKGTSYAPRGMLLPPWDTRVTLDRLALLLRRYRPRIVVALGDSFHDRDAAARMPDAERQRLRAITAAFRFIWVQGNHDPEPPDGLGGEAADSFAVGPLTFRHQADPAAANEISGHHHPKAAIPARGTAITRPCFVTDARRVVMPAFGAYTGGMDVREPGIAGLFPRGARVFLLGRERLYSFAIGPHRRQAAP
jgi:DNA ligase-associated metallophosphoesterase